MARGKRGRRGMADALGSDDDETTAPQRDVKPKILHGQAAAADAADSANEYYSADEGAAPVEVKPKPVPRKGSSKKGGKTVAADGAGPSQMPRGGGGINSPAHDGGGPSRGGGDGGTGTQRRGGGADASQRGHSWTAASNVAPDLQPKIKHAFIQVMMARGWMAQNAPAEAMVRPHTAWATQTYQELSGAPDDSTFGDFLADINGGLAFLELQIRRMLSPGVNACWYIALVNQSADDSSKMLTANFSHAELAYFRTLIEAIACSDQEDAPGVPRIGTTSAMNLEVYFQGSTQQPAASQATQATPASSQAGKPLSKSEKGDALRRFTAEGWMARSPLKGFGVIGPRTFMALGQWLLSLELPAGTREAWERLL